jgi:hypothetical protein
MFAADQRRLFTRIGEPGGKAELRAGARLCLDSRNEGIRAAPAARRPWRLKEAGELGVAAGAV